MAFTCPSCRYGNTESANFCVKCGASFAATDPVAFSRSESVIVPDPVGPAVTETSFGSVNSRPIPRRPTPPPPPIFTPNPAASAPIVTAPSDLHKESSAISSPMAPVPFQRSVGGRVLIGAVLVLIAIGVKFNFFNSEGSAPARISETQVSMPVAETARTPVVNETQPSPAAGLASIAGNHRLATQWISWESFGNLAIKSSGNPGVYNVSGGQQSPENKNYLKVDGLVVQTAANKLWFRGTIVIYVDFISPEPFVREGVFNFVANGNRKYWRLQEMDRSSVTDYVDIFF
jgi:hypothetical protein